MQFAAAQVEIPVRQAQILRQRVFRENGKRRSRTGTKQGVRIGNEFHHAGGEFCIDRLLAAQRHLSVELHHAFLGKMRQCTLKIMVGMDNHLGDAVVIAQVDEEDSPVIPFAVYPAADAGGFSDITFAQCSAGVGPVGTSQ